MIELRLRVGRILSEPRDSAVVKYCIRYSSQLANLLSNIGRLLVRGSRVQSC